MHVKASREAALGMCEHQEYEWKQVVMIIGWSVNLILTNVRVRSLETRQLRQWKNMRLFGSTSFNCTLWGFYGVVGWRIQTISSENSVKSEGIFNWLFRELNAIIYLRNLWCYRLWNNNKCQIWCMPIFSSTLLWTNTILVRNSFKIRIL